MGSVKSSTRPYVQAPFSHGFSCNKKHVHFATKIPTSGPVNLDKGPQPGVSTSVGNTVDIRPLTREPNVKVNESIEVIENIQCDLLKSFHFTKTNGLSPSEDERLAATSKGLNAFGSYLSVANHDFISFKQS